MESRGSSSRALERKSRCIVTARRIESIAAVGTLLASFVVALAPGEAQTRRRGPKDIPDGPAPVVRDVDEGAASSLAQFAPSSDERLRPPPHPPIGKIPPMPMPAPRLDSGFRTPLASRSPGMGIAYDSKTGEVIETPMDFAAMTGGGLRYKGGYSGADGGTSQGEAELFQPATMTGNMSLVPVATRSLFPARMNVKVVMGWDTDGTSGFQSTDSYFVCSGTMRDAATVLTAGHCVFDRQNGLGWADEVWVYPGW